MTEWEAFDAAEKTLAAFDARHEPKRQALMALGKAVERGWASVTFGKASEPLSPRRFAKPDFDPIDMSIINAQPGLEVIVSERRALQERVAEAWSALPQSLKDRLEGGIQQDPK